MARFGWAALCVVLFACAYSFPVAADTCAPAKEHMEHVKAMPSTVDVLPLSGAGLQAVVAYVQKINGDTTKYDTGYLAWSTTHVGVFLGNGGMICSVQVGGINHLKALVEAAEGRPA